RLPDRDTPRRAGASLSCVRHLRRLGCWPPGGGLDRHEPALRRQRAPGRSLPALVRGRPLRPTLDRRALAPAARGTCIRKRGGARGSDHARRGGRAFRRAARLSEAYKRKFSQRAESLSAWETEKASAARRIWRSCTRFVAGAAAPSIRGLLRGAP